MGGYNIPLPHNPDKNECCPSSFLPLKITTFSIKDSVKTLSSVCNAGYPASTKIENISDIMDNTHGVLNVKFRL
jgi:hypothetical protein